MQRHPQRSQIRQSITRPLCGLIPAVIGLSGVVLVSGCKAPGPPPLAPEPPATFRAPETVSVRLERYLALHPAHAELAGIDADIARLERQGGTPPVAQRPFSQPIVATLPTPDLASVPPAPVAEVDRDRVTREVKRDYALRRLAEPDPAEDRYQSELARLRRSFVEQRMEPLPAESQAALERAMERGRRLSELTRALEALAPSPEDRLRYRPEVIRERRRQREALQVELNELKAANLAALERALEVPVTRPAAIPSEMILRAQAERDRMRTEIQRDLARQQDAAIERGTSMRLPAPDVEPVLPGSAPHPVDVVERLAARVGNLPPVKVGDDREQEADSRRDTIARLRQRRETLRSVIFHDLRVAALAAARTRGETIDFARREGPDRTEALLPELTRSLRLSRTVPVTRATTPSSRNSP